MARYCAPHPLHRHNFWHASHLTCACSLPAACASNAHSYRKIQHMVNLSYIDLSSIRVLSYDKIAISHKMGQKYST